MDNIITLVNTRVPVTTFGDVVDNVLARELKYCKQIPKETADGSFVGVIQYDTNWIRNVDERIAVQFALTNHLMTNNMVNEDGTPKMFSPVIVPFHVDPEDGVPATQLRIFYYRPKATDTNKYPMSTILVRCEPFGTEVKFDVASKYANAEPATPEVA